MKRIGHLYEAICSRDNLRLAWVKARRGKAARPDVIVFGRNLDMELSSLEADLHACRWDVGHYAQFTIRAQSLLSFTARADTLAWRRKVLFGASDKGSNRVNRGGSWNNNARNCRSANRDRNNPDNRNSNLGFRVVLAPAQERVDAIH